MRKVKKPVILYPLGTIKRLANEHGLSEQAVRRMLKFEINSEMAETVRKDCIENYGGKMSDMFV